MKKGNSATRKGSKGMSGAPVIQAVHQGYLLIYQLVTVWESHPSLVSTKRVRHGVDCQKRMVPAGQGQPPGRRESITWMMNRELSLCLLTFNRPTHHIFHEA